ncbi:MAG: hypothetical protein ACI9S9_004695 [Planctomycetota bacterium]|jgi:hypothetical protein
MDLSSRPDTIHRARRLYAAGIGAFAILTSILLVSGDTGVLRALGVQPMQQPWADARTITGAGVAIDQGLDPMVTNPGDPWGRTHNYPRIWLLLAHAGVRPQHTIWLAGVFVVTAIAGFLSLASMVRDRRTALFLLVAVFAPTTWLAVERANSDLFLFGICAVAATIAASHRIVSGSLIAAASALKLYPIAGLAALLGDRRRTTLLLVGPMLCLFFAYIASMPGDLKLMQAGTMRAQRLSYGMSALPAWFAQNTPLPLWSLLLIAALLMTLLLMLSVRYRTRRRLGQSGSKTTQAAFRMGAAIYVTSFVAGANFDYRLVFLVLAVPQLCAWSRCEAWTLRRAAWVQLGVLLLTLWAFTWRHALEKLGVAQAVTLTVDEWLSWFTWGGLLCFSVLLLPDWLLPARFRGMPFLDVVAKPPDNAPVPMGVGA